MTIPLLDTSTERSGPDEVTVTLHYSHHRVATQQEYTMPRAVADELCGQLMLALRREACPACLGHGGTEDDPCECVNGASESLRHLKDLI